MKKAISNISLSSSLYAASVAQGRGLVARRAVGGTTVATLAAVAFGLGPFGIALAAAVGAGVGAASAKPHR